MRCGRKGKGPVSPNYVFDVSLVPETCVKRICDLKEPNSKFLESALVGPSCSRE